MTRRGVYYEALDRCRRRLARMALRKTGGRVEAAAKILGINRISLFVLLREHGVDRLEFRNDDSR